MGPGWVVTNVIVAITYLLLMIRSGYFIYILRVNSKKFRWGSRNKVHVFSTFWAGLKFFFHAIDPFSLYGVMDGTAGLIINEFLFYGALATGATTFMIVVSFW